MSAQEGASIPVNYLTAWQLIVVMGGLKPGETILVHSAGGGVGIAATQIAKHIGAKVIGTASAPKHGELRALGVDHSIDYRTEDFEARARQITGGRGVELILDPVGGDSSRRVLGCSRRPVGSAYSVLRRRPRTRREESLGWCPCSPARRGFSSTPCL